MSVGSDRVDFDVWWVEEYLVKNPDEMLKKYKQYFVEALVPLVVEQGQNLVGPDHLLRLYDW